MNILKDKYGRLHDYVRISLIDKCNLNCIYCNPLSKRNKVLYNKEPLSADKIIRLAGILVNELGIKKIRFTGGEPLLRKDFAEIIAGLKPLKEAIPFKTGITTNGTKLKENIYYLKKYGVDYLNISLDTLNKEKFIKITGKDLFKETIEAIKLSAESDFEKIKVNAVVMKGVNDDELLNFVDYFKDTDINLRFIEYMPFGSNDWQINGFIGCGEMKKIIGEKFKIDRINKEIKIAEDYSIEGCKGTLSFISPISNHFCNTCNRLRITSSGDLKLCLFSKSNEKGLSEMLNDNNCTDEDVKNYFINVLNRKEEKHSEVEELIHLNNNNMLSIGG